MKLKLKFLAAVLLLPCLAITAEAENSGIYTYEIVNGKAVITAVDESASGSIEIPAEIDNYTVDKIGSNAFDSCDEITAINIPNSVKTIANGAFSSCSELTEINISASVDEIGANAFSNTVRLNSINVSDDNSNFSSVSGVLFNKTQTKILCYPNGKTAKTYEIPNGVTEVGSYAFSSCAAEQVKILGSVMKINEFAFANSNNLKTVQLPESLTEIGEFAFSRCEKLESIKIPQNIAKISNYAFAYCSSLNRADIINSSAEIGGFAFKGCENLIIYGYSGSTAESYANAKQIEFIPISSYVAITGVSFGQNSITLTENSTAEIVPIIVPSDATNKQIFWSTSDENVIGISENGVISGKSIGQAIVTGTTADGEFSASCIVTIKANEPKDAGNFDNSSVSGSSPSSSSSSGSGRSISNSDDNRIAEALENSPKPYITGYKDGAFKPDGKITRAEVATIFARISDNFDSAKHYASNFSDVTGEEWYSGVVGFAAEKGIINGYTSGAFAPSKMVTRAEFAAVAVRYAELKTDENSAKFSDCKGHWAEKYVCALANSGVVGGYDDETFRPENPITRAEAVKIVNAILKMLGKWQKNSVGVQQKQFSDVPKFHWAYDEIMKAAN